MCRTRNPLLCAVPPYVLHEVAARGTERQRKWALKTLSADTTIRHGPRDQHEGARPQGPARGLRRARRRAANAARNRVIWDAQPLVRGHAALNRASATRTTRRKGRRGRRGVTTASARPTASGTTCSAATRSTTRACRCAASCTTARVRERVLGRPPRWSSATATGSSSAASPGRSTSSATSSTHGVTQYEAAARVPRPVRRAEREHLRRLRLTGQAAQARPERRRGGLADRRRRHRHGSTATRCAR